MLCKNCGNESHGHKYCYDCSSMRSNACSIIRQNSLRLSKLFSQKWYSPEGFEKFNLYVNNINKQIDILMGFLEKDVIERFNGRRD